MAIKTYKKGDSAKLSENFRAREFDCPGSGCCAETPIDEKLVQYLQQIRTHFGKPIEILAYRCPTHNARTPNASPNSRHCKGMAADFHVDGVPCTEVARYAENIGVKGIGLYDTDKDGHFIHIDTRENKSFWFGHAQEYRSTFGGTPSAEGYTLKKFIEEVQEACGAKVDGIAGPETLSKTVTVSQWINATHPVVAPIQRRLAALGYTEVGKDDCIAGVKFTAAVTAFQEQNQCWVDGEITAKNKTWRKLLEMEEADE